MLRDRMIEEMKLRNFSPATQESYVYAVSRLAQYHKKTPDQLRKEEFGLSASDAWLANPVPFKLVIKGGGLRIKLSRTFKEILSHIIPALHIGPAFSCSSAAHD